MSATHTLTTTAEIRNAGLWIAIAAGAAIAAGSVLIQPNDGWAGVLTAGVFGVNLAIGGAILLAINSVAGARWWLSFRHVSVSLARTLPAPAVALALALVLGLAALYPWARPGAMDPATPVGHLLSKKAVWLNESFFLARAVVIFILWFGFIAAFTSRLTAIRQEGPARERDLVRTSAVFIMVFALTCSVAAWDWTMSLEPAWFSTMFGVYHFAGIFQGGIAAVIVLVHLAIRWKALAPISPAQRHDLGKLLFAFSAFWAYIWFCQFMLIWYSNLPEETEHYVRRMAHGWTLIFYLNPIFNFVFPFVLLLGTAAKKHTATLVQVASVVILGRWLDAYLMVAPTAGPAPSWPIAGAGASLAVLAGMLLIVRPLLLAGAGATPVSAQNMHSR